MLTKACNIIFYTKTVPLVVWLVIFLAVSQLANAQVKPPKTNTAPQDTSKKISTSGNIASGNDSIPGKDTTAKFSDTLNIPVSSSALTSQVKYKAKDSVIYDIAAKKVYLYGTAHIEYQDIVLDAAFITIDWNTNEISAEGLPDSTGKLAGNPVFKQGDQTTRQKKLSYNFKTKKGRIIELITKEGDEGFIHTDVAKTVKGEDGKDVIFAKDAKYTTCELDDPHFYIQTNKLKLIPKDKVITGPAMIYVEKVPIPLVLPFGFFPANSRKTSGIIIPSVGNSGLRGFVLRQGGFYYGGSEYFDLALVGDIYTGGSYNASIQSNYAKRYRFDGGITLNYARLDNGRPKETPEYDIFQEFQVTWQHAQNPKAHPGTSFSANVNAGSSNYLKQTQFNANAARAQNLRSSISYGKQFRGTPFNMTAALTHDQLISTGAIDFTLPNVNFNMNRVTPFKGKNAIKKRWYHDIGISYNLALQNQLRTSDSTINNDFNWDNFRKGARHSLPVSTAFRIFEHFSFSPSVSYDGYFFTDKITQTWNSELKKVDTFIEKGFFYANTYSTNASLATQFFGLFNINRGRLVALRHQVNPSVSFTYAPDFGDPQFGYYQTYRDTMDRDVPYSVYATSIMGYPATGKRGTLGFRMENNFELKVRTRNDTTKATKKIKIFEFLTFSGAYNFLADSFQLIPFGVSASTTLFDKLSINGGAALDPYQIVTDGKGNARRSPLYEYNNSGRLGRITEANLAVTTNLNSKAQEDAANAYIARYRNPYISHYYNRPYANFDVPWNLGFGYNLRYQKPLNETFVTQTININSELNLTKKWKLQAQGDYDIRENNISFAQFNIIRDLHCWEMSFQWIPFGPSQSYFFNIHIKATTLRDLKLEKQRLNYQFE